MQEERGDACGFAHCADKKGTGKGGRSQSPGRGRSPKRKGGGKGTRQGSNAAVETSAGSNSARGDGNGKGRKVANPKLRGKSPSGKEDRPLCSFFTRGACTKGKDCDYFHPRACRSFKTEEGCKKGEDCRHMHVKAKAATAEKLGVRTLLLRENHADVKTLLDFSDGSLKGRGAHKSSSPPGRQFDSADWQTVGRRDKKQNK